MASRRKTEMVNSPPLSLILSIIDTTLQVCRLLEIELKQMLGETELPGLLKPKNNIIL